MGPRLVHETEQFVQTRLHTDVHPVQSEFSQLLPFGSAFLFSPVQIDKTVHRQGGKSVSHSFDHRQKPPLAQDEGVAVGDKDAFAHRKTSAEKAAHGGDVAGEFVVAFYPKGPILVKGAKGATIPRTSFGRLYDDTQILIRWQYGDRFIYSGKSVRFGQESLRCPGQNFVIQSFLQFTCRAGSDRFGYFVRFGENFAGFVTGEPPPAAHEAPLWQLFAPACFHRRVEGASVGHSSIDKAKQTSFSIKGDDDVSGWADGRKTGFHSVKKFRFRCHMLRVSRRLSADNGAFAPLVTAWHDRRKFGRTEVCAGSIFGANKKGIEGDEAIVKRIGLIVNPIAGMGGRVGLKGTDGADTLRRALALGAAPEATDKARRALQKLTSLQDELVIVTCGGAMGESVARALGFTTEVVYRPGTAGEVDELVIASTDEDTRAAAKLIVEQGVQLLLFAGGDGTARDVYESVGTEQVVLGIPAGVKIHSPVYANTPRQAGELALLYLTGQMAEVGEQEVVDIDEDAVRRDVLQTTLYGYLRVPLNETFMQNPKAPSALTERDAQTAIAHDIVDHMERDVCYIVGPGTTTRAIMEALSLPCTLLGVDVVLNRQLVGRDVAERDLLQFAANYACKLILTPTGGQGYLLGRGNQQISGSVVRKIGKDNIIVVATEDKLRQLRGKPLLVDTGDREADEMLAGFHRVKTGYWLETMHRIEAG